MLQISGDRIVKLVEEPVENTEDCKFKEQGIEQLTSYGMDQGKGKGYCIDTTGSNLVRIKPISKQ